MPVDAARIAEIVGGEQAVGSPIRSSGDLIRAVRGGLPSATLAFLVDTGKLSLAEIDAAILPRKTLTRRLGSGSLTAEQSDRLIRVARIIALAEETFGSPEKAQLWLRRATVPLGNVTPLSLLDTTEGAALVEALLDKIAYGVAA